MAEMSTEEVVALCAMLGAVAFFGHSLANRAWTSILTGVAISSILIGFVASALVDLAQTFVAGQRAIANLLVVLLVVATCGIGGLLVQRHRRRISLFAYGSDGSRVGKFLRWVVRARNLIVSIVVVYIVGEFVMRDGVAPVWVFVLWLFIAMVVLTSSDGLGIRANVIIVNALPRSARILRWLNIAIALGATSLVIGAQRLPVTSDESQAYWQLAVLSLIGAIFASAYAGLYRTASKESQDERIRTAIVVAGRCAVEVAWGLGVIGISFLPTVFGWSWPTSFLIVLVLSLGVAVFRIDPDTPSPAESSTEMSADG